MLDKFNQNVDGGWRAQLRHLGTVYFDPNMSGRLQACELPVLGRRVNREVDKRGLAFEAIQHAAFVHVIQNRAAPLAFQPVALPKALAGSW